ncbi:hypothetical protein PROFUN_15980 [Planoprotostelium fungivorum]|uniref:Uncharacterized protein n=1 Tax=Planoprotostelium fungivorum TaxID=1890364 RepID=A0A2P6MTV7_9EUKA|nr:hypothetical protein PROFUN_15980 [Planoprotostelium fungivorum]
MNYYPLSFNNVFSLRPQHHHSCRSIHHHNGFDDAIRDITESHFTLLDQMERSALSTLRNSGGRGRVSRERIRRGDQTWESYGTLPWAPEEEDIVDAVGDVLRLLGPQPRSGSLLLSFKVLEHSREPDVFLFYRMEKLREDKAPQGN